MDRTSRSARAMTIRLLLLCMAIFLLAVFTRQVDGSFLLGVATGAAFGAFISALYDWNVSRARRLDTECLLKWKTAAGEEMSGVLREKHWSQSMKQHRLTCYVAKDKATYTVWEHQLT